MRRLRWLLVATAWVAVACTTSTTFGPLRIEVPDGWQVTHRTDGNLQISKGTAASDTDTSPGTATAVFDLYLESHHTPDSYRELLRSENTGASEQTWTVDGERALVLSYEAPGFAGQQEAVLFPDRRILVVYRAAFPNDRTAFHDGLTAFRRAVRSIRFTDPKDA